MILIHCLNHFAVTHEAFKVQVQVAFDAEKKMKNDLSDVPFA